MVTQKVLSITFKMTLALSLLFITVQADFSFAKERKTFLIHAKTSLKIDDAQICAVPNIAWTALTKNHEVIILFDASGVTAIKRGGMFGGNKTPLDKAKLPAREREALSQQLGVQIDKVPHDYGEYMHLLKRKGVKLYANETMMLLYKIDANEFDKEITPINLSEMVELFERSDIYAAY